ncbi:MAG: hypothetical protein ABIA12_02310 [Candidatus Aenigmatarchaeota archaeon]
MAMLFGLGRKGDVDRYLLMTIVILIMIIFIVALFYGGAYSMIQNLFIKVFLR